MNDPMPIRKKADVLVVRSTYGNRPARPLAETERATAAAFTRTLAARR